MFRFCQKSCNGARCFPIGCHLDAAELVIFWWDVVQQLCTRWESRLEDLSVIEALVSHSPGILDSDTTLRCGVDARMFFTLQDPARGRAQAAGEPVSCPGQSCSRADCQPRCVHFEDGQAGVAPLLNGGCLNQQVLHVPCVPPPLVEWARWGCLFPAQPKAIPRVVLCALWLSHPG